MLSTVVAYAAEAAPREHVELPFSHWGFGGIALALFLAAFAALWSFRGTAHKVGGDHHAHDVDADTQTDASTRH